MTGFCAFTLTSATGAKFWLMPIARSSCAADLGRVVRVGHAASRAQRHVAGQLGGRRSDPGDDAVLLVGADQQRDAGRLRGRHPLQAVGQAGDLLGVRHVVRPGEVDDAADVVLLDQLLAVRDAELLLVVRDVGRVGRVGGPPVGVGDEELPDLLLQRHPLDDLVDPVAAAGRRRSTQRGHGDRHMPRAAGAAVGVGRGSRARCLQGGGARRAARVSGGRGRAGSLKPSNEISTRYET